jgi:hypothetical protein
MKGMIDKHGDIRFHKIFKWMLPTFDGESFFVCWQGCATTWRPASNQKGGRNITIVLPM